MRRVVAATLALFATAPVLAHDVWMQTDHYVVPVGAPVPYRVFVGHGTFREPWSVATDRIVSMKSIGIKSSVDLKPVVSSNGVIRFDKPGSYIVAMVSTNAKSDLPALRFNDYAKAEGLTVALALRDRLRQSEQNGREIYSRRTKMLIKVGDGRAAQPQLLQPVGMTLEIVPQHDPFRTRRGQTLPLQILYQGRPLPGATVKLNNLDSDAQPVAMATTDASGNVRFAHPGPGHWQFNVIWTRPLIGNRDAEFGTIFSSLTFGS